MEQARQHHAAGDLRAASIELKNLLQENREHADARLLLGRVYVRMGAGEAAEKELSHAERLGSPPEDTAYWHARALLQQGAYQRLLDRFPVRSEWPDELRGRMHALRAQAQVGTGAFGAAAASLDQAEALAPGDVERRIGRIQLALAQGRMEKARRIGEAAVEAHPDSGRAWRFLGRAHTAVGDLEAAEAALGRAIEHLHAPYPEYLLRAQIRLELGRTEAAGEDVAWLRDNGGDHPTVTFADGLLAFVSGEQDRACRLFRETLSKAPDMRQALYYAGVCQFRGGEYNQAASNLERAYQGRSEPRVARVLAATYLAQGRRDRAREVLRPLLQAEPDDAGGHALMARVEQADGNTSEAIEHLRRLAELRPDDPGVRLELGYGLFRAGEVEAGREVLGHALELRPDLGVASAGLVMSHIQQGDFDQALSVARGLADEQPEAPLPRTLQALAHLARGDIEAARDHLAEAVARDGADPGARHALARLAIAEGDADSAREHYRAVLADRPEHAPSLVQLALLESRAGNPERTRELLEQAHRGEPEALGPRLLLGQFSLARGDAARAIELMQGTDGTVPGDPRALGLAATAYLEQGQPAQALEHLDRLLELRPDDPGTYLMLARAYSALEQEDRAREQLRRALDLDEDNPLALVIEARVRVREQDQDAARELLERVPEAARGDPRYLDTRAELALVSGDTAAALEHYRRAQGIAPSGQRAARLAQIHRVLGEPAEAAALLDAYLAEHPADTEALRARGDLYAAEGRDDAAIEAYRAVLEQEPSALQALNNLAWVLRTREPGEALRYAEHAATLRPRDPRVLDTLAMVLVELGRAEEAVERMREAVALAPEANVLRYHYARALAAAGRDDEARAQLDDALAGDAAFEGAEAARALRRELGEPG